MHKQPGANQEEYVNQQKQEGREQLNPLHEEMINNFLKEYGNMHSTYLLTIARDGEHPARSIYSLSDPIEIVEMYNKYTDWGFAKDYLTVTLYGPGGKLAEKVLRRPRGGTQGDCTFVREDYIKAEKILLSYKDKLEKDLYKSLVKDFAGLFSRDNIRFDVIRFFKETECEEVFE